MGHGTWTWTWTCTWTWAWAWTWTCVCTHLTCDEHMSRVMSCVHVHAHSRHICMRSGRPAAAKRVHPGRGFSATQTAHAFALAPLTLLFCPRSPGSRSLGPRSLRLRSLHAAHSACDRSVCHRSVYIRSRLLLLLRTLPLELPLSPPLAPPLLAPPLLDPRRDLRTQRDAWARAAACRAAYVWRRRHLT